MVDFFENAVRNSALGLRFFARVSSPILTQTESLHSVGGSAALFLELSHRDSDVSVAFLDDLDEHGVQVEQRVVVPVVVPGADADAVVRVEAEVLRAVVDDDRAADVSAESAEVFVVDVVVESGVVAVESVGDPAALVHKVEYGVCVVFDGSCENHNLVELRHLFEEQLSVGPLGKLSFSIFVLRTVNQGFVKIQYQSVLSVSANWREKRGAVAQAFLDRRLKNKRRLGFSCSAEALDQVCELCLRLVFAAERLGLPRRRLAVLRRARALLGPLVLAVPRLVLFRSARTESCDFHRCPFLGLDLG